MSEQCESEAKNNAKFQQVSMQTALYCYIQTLIYAWIFAQALIAICSLIITKGTIADSLFASVVFFITSSVWTFPVILFLSLISFFFMNFASNRLRMDSWVFFTVSGATIGAIACVGSIISPNVIFGKPGAYLGHISSFMFFYLTGGAYGGFVYRLLILRQRTQQSDSPAILAHRHMLSAKIAMGLFISISIFFYIYFEWYTAQYNREPMQYSFLLSLFIFIVGSASIVEFVRLIVVREFAPSVIYAMIAGACIAHVGLGQEIKVLDMTAKAWFFSTFPQYCANRILPGKRASVCYHYKFNNIDQTLIFNPGDEMTLPADKWLEDIKDIFRVANEDISLLCDIKNVKKIASHIYWISGDYCQ